MLKKAFKEIFYWLWVPSHLLHGYLHRLRKRSNLRFLKQQLSCRKDCTMSFGGKIDLHLETYIMVEPTSSLSIGERVIIMDHTRIMAKRGGEILIGNNVNIGRYCIISSWYKIVIEDNVLFSSMIWITDHQHEFDLRSPVNHSNSNNLKPIIIKSGTWIGNKVTIMQGVTIGKNCVIGANSVVTKNIPDGCVAAGVPAKIIKSLARGGLELQKNSSDRNVAMYNI